MSIDETPAILFANQPWLIDREWIHGLYDCTRRFSFVEIFNNFFNLYTYSKYTEKYFCKDGKFIAYKRTLFIIYDTRV